MTLHTNGHTSLYIVFGSSRLKACQSPIIKLKLLVIGNFFTSESNLSRPTTFKVGLKFSPFVRCVSLIKIIKRFLFLITDKKMLIFFLGPIFSHHSASMSPPRCLLPWQSGYLPATESFRMQASGELGLSVTVCELTWIVRWSVTDCI